MSRKLGDILVGWGAISPAELQHCLAIQAQEPPRRRRRLGRILLDPVTGHHLHVRSVLNIGRETGQWVNGTNYFELGVDRMRRSTGQHRGKYRSRANSPPLH